MIIGIVSSERSVETDSSFTESSISRLNFAANMVVVVPTGAVRVPSAGFIKHHHIRIELFNPIGRRCGRRAEQYRIIYVKFFFIHSSHLT